MMKNKSFVAFRKGLLGGVIFIFSLALYHVGVPVTVCLLFAFILSAAYTLMIKI
jgi:hypothetical protein